VFSSLHLPFTSFAGLEPEVINVGFPYPPPTILYFAPLGLFSFDTAHVIWMVFNLFIVIGCIYLIYDQAFKEDKLVGIMLASILLFLLPDARYTIRCSQTNFIALFHLLLMYKYSDRKIGGIFLSLAVFTKPYMAILIFYFIYKKNWSAIIYFIITSLVLACITASLFGISPFITYITDNAYHRMPLYAFSETTNQSLNGFLIRMNIIPPGVSMEYKLIATLILIFTGIYMAYVARKKLYEYIMPVLLLVGLLVYPGTLQHYGIVVLFVLVLFLYKKSNLWSYLYWNAIIIGVFYALDRVSLFFVILFFLVLLILK
jgi:alpha-1,2-mannosyltransferase